MKNSKLKIWTLVWLIVSILGAVASQALGDGGLKVNIVFVLLGVWDDVARAKDLEKYRLEIDQVSDNSKTWTALFKIFGFYKRNIRSDMIGLLLLLTLPLTIYLMFGASLERSMDNRVQEFGLNGLLSNEAIVYLVVSIIFLAFFWRLGGVGNRIAGAWKGHLGGHV